MQLSLRFILPLLGVLSLLAYGLVPLVDRLTLTWAIRDLDIRARSITRAMEAPLADLVMSESQDKLMAYLSRVSQDERLYAIGFCDLHHRLVYKTETYPETLTCEQSARPEPDALPVLPLPHGPVHVASAVLEANGMPLGRLILIHDLSWLERRSSETRWYIFYLFVAVGVVVSCVTVFVAHVCWRGWVAGVRSILRGEGLLTPLGKAYAKEFQPVAQDLRALIRDLTSEQRLYDECRASWTPTLLQTILREQLGGDEIMIVSNREPYMHLQQGSAVEVQVPPSGLVTALEPVMRTCSGIWIAHGSGSADRQTVDGRDHVRVPPDEPAYELRRIWLSSEEEAGYYYGFANEGLWPLCHMAYIRPTFRSSDWKHYQAVNRRFAEAVCEEARTRNPLVLVQDYHFALLPRLIKARLPFATVITFWHIPWPNAEQFAICPWGADILEGLLGSDILGFQTPAYCNNFLDSVDRLLEARIDRHEFTVSYNGELTAVNHYPISIEWPLRGLAAQKPITECRTLIRQRYGIEPERRIGVGVDRLDYTKGIPERLRAVERLLELRPEWIGRFSFIQIAAPSRQAIPAYQQVKHEVIALAEAINSRFGRAGYRPIYLTIEHVAPTEVLTYYRGADLCIVSSLHDGMNLVAKEFVAARDDEMGVLVLSEFAGASRELPEALVVNPYDIDHFAQALDRALTMGPSEQRARMRSMRALIREFNVYRWAGRMLMDAAQMRQRERVKRLIRLAGGPYRSERSDG